jgi:hypothetical protein
MQSLITPELFVAFYKRRLHRYPLARGLKYRDDDLRWRHPRIRNKKVYLFDLGSLERCSNQANDVDDQAALFQNRM